MNYILGWCSVVGVIKPREDRIKMRRKLKCPVCHNVAWYDPKMGFRRHRRSNNPRHRRGGAQAWAPKNTRGYPSSSCS